MKRSVTIAAAATAIVVVGLSGCSSDKKSSGGSSSASNSSSGATASSGSSAAKVTIDGKDQTVQGTVACTSAAGTENIAIGGAQTGIGVVLTDASPPVVKSVGLGNVNGVTLGYTPGIPARATPPPPRTAASTRSAGPRPGWTWPTRCSP